jgi:hypothetical protein
VILEMNHREGEKKGKRKRYREYRKEKSENRGEPRANHNLATHVGHL